MSQRTSLILIAQRELVNVFRSFSKQVSSCQVPAQSQEVSQLKELLTPALMFAISI